jgi:hypothetical protein
LWLKRHRHRTKTHDNGEVQKYKKNYGKNLVIYKRLTPFVSTKIFCPTRSSLISLRLRNSLCIRLVGSRSKPAETITHAHTDKMLALFSPPADHAQPNLGGDPAAGSPTATLLRLFPPCEIWIRRSHQGLRLTQTPLGWNDGRCVQGAGTYSPRDDDARLLGIPYSRGRVSALDPN